MPIDQSPAAPDAAPANPAAAGPQLDEIVSVNDRGRRTGNKAGPFLMLGGIALVVLIALLLTVNVV
ncbi:MAG: hypothetical protein JF615_08630, partial [Asticcacaulis sp.]|nr:hypothetical protein [Asticcacaulis sp.]